MAKRDFVVRVNRTRKVVNPRMRGFDVDTSKFKNNQEVTPASDGSQKVFTCPDGYVTGTLEVYLDGLQQIKDTDWSETDVSAGTFTFTTAPDSDEEIRVSYIKQ